MKEKTEATPQKTAAQVRKPVMDNKALALRKCLHAFGYLEIGKSAQALKAARDAVKFDSGNPLVLHLYALALKENGYLNEAENAAKKVLELEPNIAHNYFLLGLILFASGMHDEAEINYQKAIALDPGNIDYQLDYAVFLVHLRKFKEVGDIAQKILAEHPSDAKAALLLRCSEAEEWRPELDILRYKCPMPRSEANSLELGEFYLNINYLDFALSKFKEVLGSNPANEAAQRGFATALKLQESAGYRWARFYSQVVTHQWVSIIVMFLFLGLLGMIIRTPFQQTGWIIVFVYFVGVLYLPYRNLQGCDLKTFQRFILIKGLTPSGEPKASEALVVPVESTAVLEKQNAEKQKSYRKWSQSFLLIGFVFLFIFALYFNVFPANIVTYKVAVSNILAIISLLFVIMALVLHMKSQTFTKE